MVEAYYSAWKQALTSKMRGIRFEAGIDHNGVLKATITSPDLPEEVAQLTMNIEIVNMGKDYVKVRLNASSGRSTWGRKIIREYKAEDYLPLDYTAPVDEPVRVDKKIVRAFSDIYDKLVAKAQEHVQAYPNFLEEAKNFLLAMKKHETAATCELEASSERSVQTDTDGNPYGQFFITLDMRGVYVSGSEVDFIEHFADILKDISKERTAMTDMVYGWDVSWRGDTLRTPLYIKYKSDGPIMTVVSSKHHTGDRVMSRTKQASTNLSTPAKYTHQLRINWASLVLGGNTPAWKIGFTYGIFPLTKMPFSGTGSVYLNGGRLWIREVDFEKAGTGLDFVLQNGLDHALEELGDKAVDAVKSIAVHDDVRDAVRLAYVNRVASTVRTPEWLEDTLDNLTRDFDATNDAKKPIYHALSNGNPVKTDLVKKLIEAIKFDIEGIEENGYGSQAEKNQMPTLKKILQWAEDAVRGSKLGSSLTAADLLPFDIKLNEKSIRKTLALCQSILASAPLEDAVQLMKDLDVLDSKLDRPEGGSQANIEPKMLEQIQDKHKQFRTLVENTDKINVSKKIADWMTRELKYKIGFKDAYDELLFFKEMYNTERLDISSNSEASALVNNMARAIRLPVRKLEEVDSRVQFCTAVLAFFKKYGRQPTLTDKEWTLMWPH